MNMLLNMHSARVTRGMAWLTVALVLLPPLVRAGDLDSRDRWHKLHFAPEARAGHAALLDRHNQQILLVAGWGAQGYFSDVWALRPRDEYPYWTRIKTSGGPPPGRMQHLLVLDTATQSLIMFGGRRDPYAPLDDTWRLTLTPGAESWTEILPAGSAPEARCTTSGVYDPVNDRVVVFGGRAGEGGPLFRDTWALDLATLTWTEIFPGGEIPSARRSAAAVYDPAEHRMVIFGGWNESEGFLNEVWVLSLDQGAESWTRLNPAGPVPAPRMGHDATYDYVDHRMLIYGGWDYPPFHFYNDVHALDLSTVTWAPVSPLGNPPPARRDVSAVFFAMPEMEGLVVFGGDIYDYQWYGDTYLLQFE